MMIGIKQKNVCVDRLYKLGITYNQTKRKHPQMCDKNKNIVGLSNLQFFVINDIFAQILTNRTFQIIRNKGGFFQWGTFYLLIANFFAT